MKYEPTTILHLIEKGLKRNISNVFIATKRGGKWIEISPENFTTKVRHFALGLYELGVRRGDRISLHSENSTEWVIADQAVLSLGAANVPIYTTQPADQIKYILENSGSKVHIVSNDELFAETKPIMKSIEKVTAVISVHGSQHKKLRSFESVIELGERKEKEVPELFEQLRSEVDPDDLATIIYTSGTTGLPKGVKLSHNNIGSNMLASMERVPFDPNPAPGERMLSYLPLSHIFERLITYLYLHMGYPIYYIENIDQIKEDLKEVQPMFFATIPRLLEKIYTGIKARGQEFSGLKKNLYYWAVRMAENYDPEHPPTGFGAVKQKLAYKLVYSKIHEQFGGKLLGMISGGAALAPDIFQFMNGIGFYCGQGYGLTEMSPVISVTDRRHMKIGTSGPPLSNVEVKIADDGEILARGPNLMKGYFRNEEKTREVITDDGWLMTGDIGKLEDGYLYVTDRKTDVFKLSTGKFVAPQPIQNALISTGFIEQVIVLGYQRKFCSALIVPNYDNVRKRLKSLGLTPGEDLTYDPQVRKLIEDQVEKVNQGLSPWERVKKFILLDEPFSLESGEITHTLKLKRNVINERYGDEIDSMYEDEEKEPAEEA